MTNILFLGIFAVLPMTKPVLAQMEMPSVDERIEELNKVVDLSDEQEKKFREIFEEQAKAQEEAASERRNNRRRGRDGDSNDRRSSRGNNERRPGRPGGPGGRGFFQQLGEILTEDQMTKYRNYQREQMITHRLERYEEQLSLNEKQTDKIKKILVDESKDNEKFFESMRDLPQEERREAFSKMREMREKTNEKIKKVLNDDQKKKFDEMLEEMQSRFRNRQNN